MEKKRIEHKKFLGMPMKWDLKNAFRQIWNAQDDRLFPPKNFGIGWGFNFRALAKKLGLIPKS